MTRLLAALWVSVPAAAWAGVSGHISGESQAVALGSSDPLGGTRQVASVMLQESLGLHYSGLPFGPNVALISAGIEGVNANSWGSGGVALAGRSASLDLSVGLLPRRALPLRLYARGTLSDGGAGSPLTIVGRESLLYGASLNLDPGAKLPGFRLDAQEQRFTGPLSLTPLAELNRSVVAGAYRAIGDHQLNAWAQFRQDARTALGTQNAYVAGASWSSPRHQTNLSFTQSERDLASPGLGAGGPTTERFASLGHAQRWRESLASSATARLVDSRFVNGSGTQVGLGLGTTWRPWAAHDLTFSASGDVGTTLARNDQGTSSGYSAGGGGRVAYARPVSRVLVGASVGGSGAHCRCVGSGDGSRGTVEVGLWSTTLDFEKFEARAEYRVAGVVAPAFLGGSRLEHHVLGAGQARLKLLTPTLSLGFDDAVRDYVDVVSGTTIAFRERVFVGALGASMPLGKGSVSGELRHARGASFVPQSQFVNAPLPAARTLTNVRFDGVYPITRHLETRAGVAANWTTFTSSAPLFTAGAQVGLTANLGRLSAALTYQLTTTNVSGLVSTQNSVRLYLTRPFSL